MRAHTMTKVALLLSLLALGALALVACGGGDDDQTTAASETETAGEELAADYRSCGSFGRYRFAVVEGDISCREARGVMDANMAGGVAVEKLPGGWICSGSDAYGECFDLDPATGEAENTIRARVRENVLRRWRAAEAQAKRAAEAQAKLSRKQVQELKRGRGKEVQELKRAANDWASLFADTLCNRYMGQPICERLDCLRHVLNLDNCTRMSKEFQKSFADATVEDIEFKGVEVLPGPPGRHIYYLATVEFSNGEVVVFNRVAWTRGCAGPGSGCVWNVEGPERNRRFFEAAAPRE
jgi:hypothetical protein